MKAAPLRATKAGASTEGIGPRNSTVVKPTEGAGVRCLTASQASLMSLCRTIKVRSIRIKAIAINDGSTVGDERVVVVNDSAAAAPIKCPIVPTPTKPGKNPNAESQTECDSWPVGVESRIRIPTGKNSQRRSVNNPGIVLRYINHVGGCRLNSDTLSLRANSLLA